MRNTRKFTVLLLFLLALCLPALCAQAASGQISGYAWQAQNGDTTYDANDRGLSGVVVTLHRAQDGAELSQQTVGRNGAFAFTGLSAGEYYLSAKLPAGYQFIEPAEGGSVMLPADGGSSTSAVLTLADGQSIDHAHIGASKSVGHLRVYAFEDKNANGGRSSSEEMLRGVQTELYYQYQGEWVMVASDITDREGCATYWSMTPGTYRMRVVLPDPYIIGPLGEKINAWYNCFPPCDSNEGWSEPFVVPRGNSLNLGLGAVSTGSLSGSLWYDANMDGLRGADEGGYAGATITLDNDAAGVHRTLTSTENGQYHFDRLLAGTYTLTVTLPESTMFTLPAGDSQFTGGYAFSQSISIGVSTGETSAVRPIGVMDVTTLEIRFYHDLNADGTLDAGDLPFPGATAEILDAQDKVLLTVTSDNDGIARFPVLRGGDNRIRCALPDGQVFTIAGSENDFVSLAAQNTITLERALPHGQASTLYAGVTLPAQIAGTLFLDQNVSGVMDNGEHGQAGFTVQAVNMRGEVTAETVTDDQGRYQFDSLLPAAHTVRFLLQEAYVFVDPSETGAAVENHVILQTAEYGETAAITLAPGQTAAHIDGGVFRSATVSGRVLLDSGLPSLPLSGGLAGVRVSLLDEYGAPVSDTTTTYTDENGDYYLKGALPGVYSLEYQLPAGTAFTVPLLESDVWYSEPFTVVAADDLTQQPLYAVPTSSLSGMLYQDSDLNGEYAAGEPVLVDVTITAHNTDLDITYETRSLDNGQYIFDSLRPGVYMFSITLEDSRCLVTDDSSPFAATPEATATAEMTFGAGDHQENRNIATSYTASLTGKLFMDQGNDNHLDAQDAGAPQIPVTLKAVRSALSYTLLTDENGAFTLPALAPGDYQLLISLPGDCIPADGNTAVLTDGFWVSDVHIDSGSQLDLTYAVLRYARAAGHVWSMDGSLTGVSGRTVTLYQGDQILSTAVTDENGAFEFLQLKPGRYSFTCDLPEGSYRFARSVDTAEHPSLITSDQSVVLDRLGYSDEIEIPMGQDVNTCDFGIGALGKLGDTAWLDENGNGMQDEGELPVPGIEIALYQYGELINEATTDQYGHYLFTDLYPGVYTVRVTMHKELKTTVHQTDFPLVASVLPESDELTVEAEGIVVPSNGRNLSCDFGFVLRKAGQYPEAMSTTLPTSWDDN